MRSMLAACSLSAAVHRPSGTPPAMAEPRAVPLFLLRLLRALLRKQFCFSAPSLQATSLTPPHRLLSQATLAFRIFREVFFL